MTRAVEDSTATEPRSPVRRTPVGLVAAALRNGGDLPAWLWAVGLTVLLAAAWLITYSAGGTRTAYPHLFYVPVVLAALPFGLRGAATTAVVATVLCGPLMPLATETGEQQQVGNWLLRGAFFLAVAAVTALLCAVQERSYERQIEQEFTQELDRSRATTDHAPVPRALIDRVIAERLFHPVFQPIYSLRDGRLRSVEALTRFDTDPAFPPQVWFDAARQAGQGVALELCAVEAALAASAGLPDDVALSVNAGPATLVDPRFLELVQAAGSRGLIVEVTEHAVVTDYRLLQRCLEDLRARGVLVAVDDAGAGVSSLLHIVQLAPDIIKIDLALSQGVGASPVRRALARSLVDFANRTGADVVVEGIERATDLHAWADLGAHAVQGYLVGRPGHPPFAPSSAHITRRRSARPRGG